MTKTRFIVKLIDANRRWTAVAVLAKTAAIAEALALAEAPQYVAARASVHKFQ